MFLRALFESLERRWNRKLVAVGAVWTGITLITAFLTVSLTVGDRLNQEMQSFGANIRVEPANAAIVVRVGGQDLTPTVSRAYLSEHDVPKLKREIFWRNNIHGIAPRLTVEGRVRSQTVPLVGVWLNRAIALPDGGRFHTGAQAVYKNWGIDGRWPRASAECLVGKDLAVDLGVRPGATLEVKGSAKSALVRVSGVMTTGGPDDGALVTQLSVAQDISGLQGKISRIDLSALANPEDNLAVKYHEDPASLTPTEYERWSCVAYPGSIALAAQKAFPNSAATVVRQISETQGSLLNQIQSLMTTLALITVLASVLSIMGALASTILERRQEAALLQAIGARPRDVLALFVSEAGLLGLVGGVLAAFTGPALGGWLIRLVFETTGSVTPLLAFLTPVLGIAVAVIASVWPISNILGQTTARVLHGG